MEKEKRKPCGTTYCSAFNCSNNRRQAKKRSFFSFPLDSARCKKWVIACRRADLINKHAEYLHKNCTICSDHFEDCMFLNDLKNRLHSHAVPTKFDVPNPPPLIQSQRKLPKKRVSVDSKISSVPSKCSRFADSCVAMGSENTASSLTLEELEAARILVSLTTPADGMAVEQSDPHLAGTATPVPSSQPVSSPKQTPCRPIYSPRKAALKKLACKWRCRTVRLKKKLHKNLPNVSSVCSCQSLPQKLKTFMELFKTQNKYRYSESLKSFALSVHFLSPKTYKYLRNHLPLPTPRLLQKLLSKVSVGEGSTDWVTSVLKVKASELSPRDKNCVVCVDEMALKRHLQYNPVKDEVVGFARTGTVGKPELATSALVFMAKGLFQNWKQPLTYHFVADSCPAEKVKEILFSLVQKLKEVGLIVRVVISDMGSNFLEMTKLLSVTPEKPYFELDCQKIFYCFDTSHLQKSSRNNLMKHTFHFDGKVACWKDIETMYLQDKTRSNRLASKLTDNHIYLNGFSKMRVKLAAQVLSHTCAAAINTSVAMGLLPASASGTAELLQKFDTIFDCVNSSSLKSPKKYRCALTETSGHKEFISEFLVFLDHLVVRNCLGKDVTKTIKCLSGWRISLRAILGIWEQMKTQENVQFLFTRRLNQDALENYFSTVRQQGGNCDNPTPYLFSCIFKKLLVQVELQGSPTSNCMWDSDKWIVNVADLSKKVLVDANSSQLVNSSLCCVNHQDYRHLNVPEQNALVYICGYLMSKALMRHSCGVCENYASGNASLTDSSQLLCYFRAYDSNRGDFGGLMMPCEDFVSFIVKLDELFQLLFEKHKTHGIAHTILQAFQCVDFFHPCPSFPKSFIMKLFLRMKIYHSVKRYNRDIHFQLLQKRRNRKANKVLHK